MEGITHICTLVNREVLQQLIRENVSKEKFLSIYYRRVKDIYMKRYFGKVKTGAKLVGFQEFITRCKVTLTNDLLLEFIGANEDVISDLRCGDGIYFASIMLMDCISFQDKHYEYHEKDRRMRFN